MITIVHTYWPVEIAFVERRDEIEAPVTLNGYLDEHGIDLEGRVIAARVDEESESLVPILRKNGGWDRDLEDGSQICFVKYPGDTGGGGSNPLQTLATIALITVSANVPGAIGMTAGTWGSALVSAGVIAVGSQLIQPLFNPNLNQAQVIRESSSQDAGGVTVPGTNVPSASSIVPVQFGRMTRRPPRAAYDWSEYLQPHPHRPSDRKTYITLTLGPGKFLRHKVLIGGQDATTLPGVTMQMCDPGVPITLPGHHDNVYTNTQVGGAELSKYGKRYYRSNQIGAAIFPDRPGSSRNYASNPSRDGHCYIVERMFEKSERWQPFKDFMAGDRVIVSWPGGSAELTVKEHGWWIYDPSISVWSEELLIFEETAWPGGIVPPEGMDLAHFPQSQGYVDFMVTEWVADARVSVGPYRTCRPDQSVNKISIDLFWPMGCFEQRDDGTQGFVEEEFRVLYQMLGEDGLPTGAQSVLHTISVSERTNSRLFRSYDIAIPAGCHHIWLDRAIKISDVKVIDTVQWVGLRGWMAPQLVYEKDTILALQLEQSMHLSQHAINDIEVDAERLVPVFEDGEWTEERQTRNPAWQMGDWCRNTDYSIGLDDAQVDGESLRQLATTLDARGDTCDGLMTQATTFWNGLEMIARTGRIQPSCPGGVITGVRDEPKTVIRKKFNVRNIKQGSFRIDPVPVTDETPDDIIASYYDAALGRDGEPVRVSLPDSDGLNPVDFSLWGVGNREQIQREALAMAGSNLYRRLYLSFIAINFAARTLRRGHLILVSHPLVGWGVSGDVLEAAGPVLRLSEPVEFVEDKPHYVSLSDVKGGQGGVFQVTPGSDPHHVVMAETAPEWVYTGHDRDRTTYHFGTDGNYGRRCITVSAQPLNENGDVKVVAFYDDPRAYPEGS